MEIFNQIKLNIQYEEANVLVTSKTKASNNNICIEAITKDGKNVRLLYSMNSNISETLNINIYDNLLIKYQELETIQFPHAENINVFYIKIISKNNKPMLDILNTLNINILQGDPTSLFDKKLVWTQDTWHSMGYVSLNNVPEYSIHFWIADKDLYLNKNKYEYIIDDKTYSMQYTGVHKPQDCIYKGTLIKISLANWWNNNSSNDSRCILELSEYYPYESETDILNKITSSIDNKTMILVNYFVNGDSIVFDNVIPYKVIYLEGNYYLACKVDTPYKFTLFRVSKIRAVNTSTNKFIYNQNMLDFLDYIQTPFSKYSDNFKNTMIKVKVEVDKSKASFFEIRKHLDSQKIIRRLDNGNIIVSFLVTQELEMEELIKKWIPYIKVLEPASLDEKIKHDIKKYLNYYTKLPWEKF